MLFIKQKKIYLYTFKAINGEMHALWNEAIDENEKKKKTEKPITSNEFHEHSTEILKIYATQLVPTMKSRVRLTNCFKWKWRERFRMVEQSHHSHFPPWIQW